MPPSLLDSINSLSRSLRQGVARRGGEARYSVDQWINDYLKPSTFNHNGVQYVYGTGPYSRMVFGNAVAEISSTLPAYAAAMRAAPPAFAAQMVRALILSQARFTFRGRQSSSKPRRTFGTRALGVLEQPGNGLTTGKLLAQMEWHAGVAGNAFVYRQAGRRPGDPPRLRLLRPDWTAILWGSDSEPEDAPFAIDAEVLGYVYWNGGYGRNTPRTILPNEMCHWAPIPDSENAGLGMSWVTPAIREMQGDTAATEHKLRFFANGATPAMVVKNLQGPNGQALDKDQFNAVVDMLEARHAGVANAYRTLYLTGGADATVIGADLKQIDFKATQGGGETRISFLSRVPAALLGISEGLAGSSLNAGNFGMARRIFADSWVYPTLQDLAGSFADIVEVPADAELWPDTSDMPILREDSKDQAEITQIQAAALSSLINAGYTPDSSQQAVTTGDLSQLKHTGLFSVQLQPPQNGQMPGAATPGGAAPPADPTGQATPAATDADWNAALAAANDAQGRSTTASSGARTFDPHEPRDPHGQWAKVPGVGAAKAIAKAAKDAADADAPGDGSAQAFQRRADRAVKGAKALDSAPVHLARAEGRHGGRYDGAEFSTAPPGHGDPRAVAEMEGLEYQETNMYLWDEGRGRDRTLDGSGNPYKPEQLEYWAARDAKTQHRIAEVDKSLAVSPLPHDVVVYRGVKSGSDTFGSDVWFGLTPWSEEEDPHFERQDAEYERFEGGWRPDLTGLEWTQHSYLHSTVRDELMSEYAKPLGGLTGMPVAMRIVLPAGTPAIRMSDMDLEAELMAARGLKLRVVKDHGEDDKGVRHFDIEVVGQSAT